MRIRRTVTEEAKKEMAKVVEDMYALWRNGLSPMDISRKLKIAHNTVYKYIIAFKTKNSQEQIEFLGIE